VVGLDTRACDAVVGVLRQFAVPDDREETSLPELASSDVPNFYFYLVAVCHQTSPVGVPPVEGFVNGVHRRGWDYLWARFAEECARDRGRLSPGKWASESEESLAEAFWDSRLGVRLTRLDERATLIRDLGRRLQYQGVESVQALFDRCRGYVRRSDPNLLGELRAFEAYADPVEKKSIFFLSLMRNSGLWKYPDADSLEAPVDYHEVRGHLRLGTVRLDGELAERLRSGAQVSEADDVAIRSEVRKAIRYIADQLGITPSTAHYMFWNVFRSICHRELPECLEVSPTNALPERYRPLLFDGQSCPFVAVCPSARSEERLVEHRVVTHFY